MLATRFTELVGCRVPIQSAGMGAVATPELVGAVSEAGGLGMLGAPLLTAAELAEALEHLRARKVGPVGVTFIISFLERACVEVAASRAKVVEFSFGPPDRGLVDLVHAGGALASWQVGSREEALAAVEAGCDFIIAQGVEAGGHLTGRMSLFALLEEVLDVVKVPVLAAGGIGSGRTMAAALAAGASGVRLGTRFVASREANIHPIYAEKLLQARAKDTVFTNAFDLMMPGIPHRVLRSCIEAAEAFQGDVTGELVMGNLRMPLPRWSVPSPTRQTTGAIEAMALYAGESVSAVKSLQPAAEIVKELAEQAEQHLRQAARRLGQGS
ncbi:NAD(P)H-dependent flavin oxidoreductase [Archangium lipolyticum]|uniref:NAD(P)H-dependent flavin oxidoreductase n=1 Tax=Archangium lipolyticum TaxID=2970465 RepID=UPI002149F90E|nr:nitronate monooxygenase [Archangium lipolyticum]